MSENEIKEWVDSLMVSTEYDVTLNGKHSYKEAINIYTKAKKKVKKALDLKLDDNHIKMLLLAGIHATSTEQDSDTMLMVKKPMWGIRRDFLRLALQYLGKLNPEQDELAGVLLRPLPLTKTKSKIKAKQKLINITPKDS